MDTNLKTHALTLLRRLLSLLTLLLLISIETYIFFNHPHQPTYQFLPLLLTLLVPTLHHLSTTTSSVYVADFACLQPPPSDRIPISYYLEHLSLIDCFDQESISFMSKVLTSSGLGNETSFPPPLHYIPPNTSHRDATAESEYLLFPALNDLLSKTNIPASSIDILVVNCSGFCPSPSLTSIVVQHYNLRDDILTFNVSGMGCSAGAVSLDIASGLLKSRRGSYAVVLSTEILCTGWYNGRDRRKLLLNCFFRTGASAVLLTNRRNGAKYRVAHLVREHGAFDDRAYLSAIREEDAEGITGFSIERDLLYCAAETMKKNVVALAMAILPAHVKIMYAAAWLRRKMVGRSAAAAAAVIPDFGAAVQHYCLPATGLKAIEEIGRRLGLGERATEAARMAFRRFGNQSASSMWYQLAFAEAKGRVRKGERVWMLAMGSGPKSNSVVLERVKEMAAEAGPWEGSIQRFPSVDVDEGLS